MLIYRITSSSSNFLHTTCESTYDILLLSAANQGKWQSFGYEGGTVTSGATSNFCHQVGHCFCVCFSLLRFFFKPQLDFQHFVKMHNALEATVVNNMEWKVNRFFSCRKQHCFANMVLFNFIYFAPWPDPTWCGLETMWNTLRVHTSCADLQQRGNDWLSKECTAQLNNII